ncbi:DUF4232 domain-containing protein [Streptomyces sp. J2-1]|uniref:DUF4232 domain-containing protein n=1 Tax=Streptomyces corallincola TaxID=2851888 RepID=UPI001C384DEB|nr:DUF4232 domain-containing protein [Streptomyces corallincola]MBV2354758.1 DUF4232 domain-containing protein [Streptomyces corallincola]
MSSLRTSRTVRTSRIRLAGAVAGAAIAALSLTACGTDNGVRDEGASAHATDTSRSTGTGTDSASQAPSSGSASSTDAGSTTGGSHPAAQTSAHRAGRSAGTTGTTAASKGASTGTGSGTSAGSGSGTATPVTCEGSVTKTTASPLARPLNHLLLTVTNTGSRTCYLYGYPAVRFGADQAVPPVIGDSKPQAVVTLQPGESGYAAVLLSAADGSAAHGRTATSLTVYFQGRSLSGSTGTPAHPSLPAAGVHVDDSLKVTYWQQSMDDAINW